MKLRALVSTFRLSGTPTVHDPAHRLTVSFLATTVHMKPVGRTWGARVLWHTGELEGTLPPQDEPDS